MGVGAGARKRVGMNGKRLRGQGEGFGCGWELHFFEKDFSKWNKMSLLLKNKE